MALHILIGVTLQTYITAYKPIHAQSGQMQLDNFHVILQVIPVWTISENWTVLIEKTYPD